MARHEDALYRVRTGSTNKSYARPLAAMPAATITYPRSNFDGRRQGGSSDTSGMMEAMASAQAAQQAYQLGEQQLQWTQQVWNQEQPLMDASEQQQMALAAQEQAVT